MELLLLKLLNIIIILILSNKILLGNLLTLILLLSYSNMYSISGISDLLDSLLFVLLKPLTITIITIHLYISLLLLLFLLSLFRYQVFNIYLMKNKKMDIPGPSLLLLDLLWSLSLNSSKKSIPTFKISEHFLSLFSNYQKLYSWIVKKIKYTILINFY